MNRKGKQKLVYAINAVLGLKGQIKPTPWGQSLQNFRPVFKSLYRPCWHDKQMVCAREFWYLPLTQASHESSKLSWFLKPNGQFLQLIRAIWSL